MYFCLVKVIKSSFVGLLILFTFFGNVGMSVFTHSCKEDGVFRSYFVKTTDHCNNHEEEIVHACCKLKQEDSESLKKKNCCDDEVSVFKINLDYFSDYQVEIPLLSICENPTNYEIKWQSNFQFKLQREYSIHPPPRPSGKELLIKHQVFRI